MKKKNFEVNGFRDFVMASSEEAYVLNPDWSKLYSFDRKGSLSDTKDDSKSWLEKYILPEEQPFVKDLINETIRAKKVFELEHRVPRKDGQISWIFSRVVPLLDMEGNIVEWFGIASNFTKRKEAEEALRKSEERLTRELEDAKLLQELSTQLIKSGNNVESLYEKILATLVKILRSDFATFQQYNPEGGIGGELHLLKDFGFDKFDTKCWERITSDSKSSCSMAIKTR